MCHSTMIKYWGWDKITHIFVIFKCIIWNDYVLLYRRIVASLDPAELITHRYRYGIFTSTWTPMGFLPDTKNCGLRMRRECRERFPRYRRLAIPTCTKARAWCTWLLGRGDSHMWAVIRCSYIRTLVLHQMGQNNQLTEIGMVINII